VVFLYTLNRLNGKGTRCVPLPSPFLSPLPLSHSDLHALQLLHLYPIFGRHSCPSVFPSHLEGQEVVALGGELRFLCGMESPVCGSALGFHLDGLDCCTKDL